MNNNNTIFNIFQTFLTKEEVTVVCDTLGYKDTSRKFTVYDLYKFFIAAATNEYKSFRSGSDYMHKSGLKTVDYSTLSKKASDVDYNIAKKLFEILIEKCNRATKRALKLPKDLLAVDSTTITVGEGRLKWAKFRGEKSGIKLHVALNVSTLMPQKVIETVAKKHDGPIGEEFVDTDCILVEDRAYGKHTRYDIFDCIGQSFVIRIKDNVKISQSKNIKSFKTEDSNVVRDFTCYLGENSSKTQKRFRVVEFIDFHGKNIRVCTNIKTVTPEKIADIYKERWKVESFFRFIKQNLNVKNLFGTTQNAVYNQLFIALISYVLLHFSYVNISKKFRCIKLSFCQFIRKLLSCNLQNEVQLLIYLLLQNINKNQEC